MPENATKPKKFDKKKLEDVLRTEKNFIKNLYSILSAPMSTINESDELITEVPIKKTKSIQKTTRAKSLVDLQARIDKLKNKNNINYKEKLQKKNLKSRLNKKIKKENRTKGNKVKSETPVVVKLENDLETEKGQKITKENKMAFSKFNFEGLGKQRKKKVEKDPKKILEQVEQVNEKVARLQSIGEADKAIEIKEKTAWKNALAKAQGVKVKDDPMLLKKSIKKMEQKKRSSKKKWEARMEGVQKAKDERQKKRTENIEKRKKEKKVTKLKKAAKKGKIIPGF